MLTLFMGIALLAAVVAIFATTRAGSALRARVGFGMSGTVSRSAPSEDVEFLLARCGRDPREVARRVEAERVRFPALSEADHYRRAIRRLLNESEARSQRD